jgi:hypothetical protein
MAFSLVLDYTPGNGPIASSANPGSIGNGLTDVSGNIWSIDANNNLQSSYGGSSPTNAALLAAQSISLVDTQITIRKQAAAGTFGADCFGFHRITSYGATPNGYIVGIVGGTPQAYKVIAGVLTQVGTTGALGATLTAGTYYDYVGSVVQTNGTTTTLTCQVFTTAGVQVGSTYTVTDATASLQNVSGGAGLPGNSNVSAFRVYTDVTATNATSYTVSLPSAMSAGVPSRGTVTLVGGTVLSAPLVVTVTDSAGGTFTNMPLTINSGSLVGYFTCAPSGGGTKTFTSTHTGGNAGMTDAGSSTSTVPNSNLVLDYTPTAGPIGASASPGAIGNGLTDVTGNVWSIDSNNLLQSNYVGNFPYNFALLAAESVSLVDTKISIRKQVAAGTFGADCFGYLRATNYGATGNGYLIGIVGGAPTAYTVVGGVTTQIGSGTLGATLTPGTFYDYVSSVVQTNGTTTTLTARVFTTSGVQVGNTYTVTDTTVSLQNVAGGAGVSGNTNISAIRIYNDLASTNATAYTVSLPSAMSTGTSYRGTVTLVGGTVLTAPLVVTIAEGSGGAFTGIPVAINSNSLVGYFTHTPATAGTKTFTCSHTGGNAGMGDVASFTSVVTLLVTLLASDPAAVFSPYNQDYVSGPAGSARSCYPGSYARYYFKGCTSVNLLLDTAPTNVLFQYQIDTGPLSAPILSSSSPNVQITIPDTGSHVVSVFLMSIDGTTVGKWNGARYLGILGFTLGPGGSKDIANVVRGSRNILWLGDSISESAKANDGVDANTYSSSYTVCQSLFASLGFEYGIVAVGGLGYTVNLAVNGVPPAYTVGNDTLSSWNKINASVSRLVSGQFSPQPDIIYENYGANDQNSATVTSVIPPLYQALRSAAPTALIIKAIPYMGLSRVQITAGILTYMASSADSLLQVIDLNIDARLTGGSYTGFGDTTHPGRWGHSNIGTLVLARILKIWYAQFQSTSGTGGGNSGAIAHAYANQNFSYGGVNYIVGNDVRDPNYSLINADPYYAKKIIRSA